MNRFFKISIETEKVADLKHGIMSRNTIFMLLSTDSEERKASGIYDVIPYTE
jgi:hypothetical protein